MTGKRVSLLFAFVAVLLMPSRAAAEGGLWEFLEKLSGPGPFHGIVFDLPIACRVHAVGDPNAKVATGPPREVAPDCLRGPVLERAAPPQRPPDRSP